MERTEKAVKGYYRKKGRLNILLRKLDTQQRRIERITKDIKNCNITIEVPIGSTDYSRERVQGGQVTSSIELALERSIDMLIKELERAMSCKIRLESRIRNLEEEIMNIEMFLEDLEEEEKILFDLIYEKRKTQLQISIQLNTSQGNVCKIKKRALGKIKQDMNKR